MDSSFLTGLHIGLGLIACLLFLKLIIQFGLPNHPSRFISYVVCLCIAGYFVGLALTDLSLINPFSWMRWRSLPLIAGSLCLLFQTVLLSTQFSMLQQQVISRVPLMAALLCFAFFPSYADAFTSWVIVAGGLFLIISVKKARYQKRLYLKMLFMFLIYLGLNYINIYATYVAGEIVLIGMLFYIFLFEQSSCLAALVDEGDLR